MMFKLVLFDDFDSMLLSSLKFERVYEIKQKFFLSKKTLDQRSCVNLKKLFKLASNFFLIGTKNVEKAYLAT